MQNRQHYMVQLSRPHAVYFVFGVSASERPLNDSCNRQQCCRSTLHAITRCIRSGFSCFVMQRLMMLLVSSTCAVVAQSSLTALHDVAPTDYNTYCTCHCAGYMMHAAAAVLDRVLCVSAAAGEVGVTNS